MENQNKPDWLVALESQSWQAELVVSVLAIYEAISLDLFLPGIAEY